MIKKEIFGSVGLIYFLLVKLNLEFNELIIFAR